MFFEECPTHDTGWLGKIELQSLLKRPRLFPPALLLALTFLLPDSAQAQKPSRDDSTISVQIGKSIEHIYNLEFPEAERELREVIRQEPNHPAGHFFRAMVEWWRILIVFDDESRDDGFYDMLEKVIDLCDQRLEKDPRDVTALFFKGGAIGFRGRLRANRGSWLSAANDGIVALPLVRRAYAIDPSNKDILLGIGIYNYYAAVVPDRYPIVRPLLLFFPSGDRRKGLEQLRDASREGTYAAVEATYFLLQNYYLFEKDYGGALGLAEGLHKRFPRNPVFHRYVGRCLVSLGRLQDASKVFEEVEERYHRGASGYDTYDGREAFYYLGRYSFVVGQHDSAMVFFKRCENLSRRVDKDGPSGFRSMANLHMGMIYDMRGRRQEALQQYRIVLAMDEYEQSHRDARAYLKKPYGK